MADIRKRTGSKGTTYQVRYATTKTKTGYAYETFRTLKEARDYRESAYARKAARPANVSIKTVGDAVGKWLDICEKEGRDGRDPVTNYTHKVITHPACAIRRQLHRPRVWPGRRGWR